MTKILEECNSPDSSPEIVLTCQVGKSIDLAKFAIKSAIDNSGMKFREDFDICFICWRTSQEVYDWLVAEGYWYVTIDWESDPDQSFHNLLYNGWRAGYEIAYRYAHFHVPIATDHYFFQDWLASLYDHKVDLGIVSCTLIERGQCFSLHPVCDLGLTTEEEFNYDRAKKAYDVLYKDERVEDIYSGQYHLDHGMYQKDGNIFTRQDAMPFIISDETYKLVGPMVNFNEHGTTGDTEMFDKCIRLGIPRYRSCGSISYHVGGVETKRNA